MTEFITFLFKHWLLALATVVVFILLVIEERRSQAAGLNPQELVRLMNDKTVTVIDVRDEASFATGHIAKAVSLPLSQLRATKSLPKGCKQHCVVVADQGGVGMAAQRLLRQLGVEKVDCLNQGMRSWRDAHLPLVKD